MHNFLRLLGRGRLVQDLSWKLIEAIGEETFNVLKNDNVLIPGERARTYPCPHTNKYCLRVIEPNPLDLDRPFLARPRTGNCCETIALRADQVSQHQLSHVELTRMLRAHYDVVDGAWAAPRFPYTTSIGRTRDGRDAIFTRGADEPGFGTFLRERRHLSRATLVLAPHRSRLLDPDVEAYFSQDGRISLLFLEDELSVHNGAIVRRPALETAAALAQSFCTAIAVDNKRYISQFEYREIKEHQNEYDLIIDMMDATKSGRCPGIRLAKSGIPRSFELLPGEVVLLREFIERRTLSFPKGEYRNRRRKTIEELRRKIAEDDGRGNWDIIRLLEGCYVLDFSAGFRFILLCPTVPRSS